MHVIYIYSIFGTTRNVGLNQLFQACELSSSKMYLTPMQLAGMNLPSFRHVVMAWKNFNDTQYDTIHGLYHRYHLKEIIYTYQKYVYMYHVYCITYTYDVNPSIDLKNPSKKMTKKTHLF